MRFAKTALLSVVLMLTLQLFGQEQKTTAPQDSSTPEMAALKSDPAFVIGAGDVLNVNVWHEPDVSGSLPVRPDGKISLPLLADVQAAGLTPTKLADTIREKLTKYITNPQVTVVVTTINSQRYFVIGEVSRAGGFPLPPNTTVLQALSNAGSFSQYANLSKIYVLRQENGKQTKFPFDYKQVLKGNSIEQNIVLRSGDTIVVP